MGVEGVVVVSVGGGDVMFIKYAFRGYGMGMPGNYCILVIVLQLFGSVCVRMRVLGGQ